MSKTSKIIIVIASVVGVILVGGLIIRIATEKPAVKSVEEATKDYEVAKLKNIKAQREYIDKYEQYGQAQQNLSDAEKKNGVANPYTPTAQNTSKGEELEASGTTTGEYLENLVTSGQIKYEEMTNEQKQKYKAYLDEQIEKSI